MSEPPIVPLGTEPTSSSTQSSKSRIDAKVVAIILTVAVLVPIIAGLAMQYNDLDKRYNKLKNRLQESE